MFLFHMIISLILWSSFNVFPSFSVALPRNIFITEKAVSHSPFSKVPQMKISCSFKDLQHFPVINQWKEGRRFGIKASLYSQTCHRFTFPHLSHSFPFSLSSLCPNLTAGGMRCSLLGLWATIEDGNCVIRWLKNSEGQATKVKKVRKMWWREIGVMLLMQFDSNCLKEQNRHTNRGSCVGDGPLPLACRATLQILYI